MLGYFKFVVPIGLIKGMTSAALHHHRVEQHILESLSQEHNRLVLQLFERVLLLAAYPDLCDVFLLVHVRYENSNIYHFLESGKCLGYLLSQGILDTPRPEGCFRVFTPEDITQYNKDKKRTCKYEY